MLLSYLENAQLSAEPKLVANKQQALQQYLNNASADVRWQYQVPELGEGGACSLFGHLQEQPFDLREHLPSSSEAKLRKLQAIVDFVVQESGVDWFGIYQSQHIEGQPRLLKLAYYGAPSRPLFPINPDFATTSNNVQVALSGVARVINDVEDYVANGGEYYTCDPKVKAESCLPLYDETGKVVGIIDAEAFTDKFFTPDQVALLIAACLEISKHLPTSRQD
ncbi:GAF domain-containing protein [Pseudoalteromonas ruthenica]|uniref:GAF domain-containing protein n=1 Tax=Pseudoalteromonas ruthenica TaxID=151081 RepID=UPI0012482FD1|nr:GAF domain-containing protein [Pseudoalteromonas ruthenica]